MHLMFKCKKFTETYDADNKNYAKLFSSIRV